MAVPVKYSTGVTLTDSHDKILGFYLTDNLAAKTYQLLGYLGDVDAENTHHCVFPRLQPMKTARRVIVPLRASLYGGLSKLWFFSRY